MDHVDRNSVIYCCALCIHTFRQYILLLLYLLPIRRIHGNMFFCFNFTIPGDLILLFCINSAEAEWKIEREKRIFQSVSILKFVRSWWFGYYVFVWFKTWFHPKRQATLKAISEFRSTLSCKGRGCCYVIFEKKTFFFQFVLASLKLYF